MLIRSVTRLIILKHDSISRRGKYHLVSNDHLPDDVLVEVAQTTLKSFTWQHFGFPVGTNNENRRTDKTRTIY